MKMLLRPEFLNGPFGDPSLYIWETNEKDALLLDCGDLTRFTPKQLLKVSSIFLSHCHMDHFFDFDLFLRIHMGTKKAVRVYGPPETSHRVAGKLASYTWNLLYDQSLEFAVVDLDPMTGTRTQTQFQAKNQFRPSMPVVERWNPKDPILDVRTYQVRTALLDHRTPSLAYAVEEKVTVSVNEDALKEMGLKPGTWINELKNWYLFGGSKDENLQVLKLSGETAELNAAELAGKILSPRQRHKIAYATDGAANPANHQALLELVRDADVLFSETCFLELDRKLADETKHFTTQFIGTLAQEAGVKKVVPFHFSKRYLGNPEQVWNEVRSFYKGEVGVLEQNPRQLRL